MGLPCKRRHLDTINVTAVSFGNWPLGFRTGFPAGAGGSEWHGVGSRCRLQVSAAPCWVVGVVSQGGGKGRDVEHSEGLEEAREGPSGPLLNGVPRLCLSVPPHLPGVRLKHRLPVWAQLAA